MPIPKRRTTRSSRGQRRSHDFLKKIDATKCPKCGESIRPHRVCSKCGAYAGKQVVNMKSKGDKKDRKDDKKKESQKTQK